MSAWQENPRILVTPEAHEVLEELSEDRGEPMGKIIEILGFREKRRIARERTRRLRFSE